MFTETSLQRAALVFFVLTPVSWGQSSPAAPPCTEWNLAADFRVAPDQENPNRDSCGNPGVWSFLQSDQATFPAHIPATYTLLPEFITNELGVEGLEVWHGPYHSNPTDNELPIVGINNTGSNLTVLGIAWPAGVMLVHPWFDALVIVGWRSPLTGTVAVTGGVQDVQPDGSDGIGWSIDHYDGITNTTVASGSVSEGGTQSFQNGSGGASLAHVPVHQGDFLYFIVDPLAWAGGDSTRLDIVITPVTACPAWNLAADFRVSPDQANPNPDSCGNLGVWHFLESDPATFPAHIPSTYTLLPEFITDAFFVPGLEQWQGTVASGGPKNKLPAVGINNTGAHQSILGIEWPAGAIRVHPLGDELVIIGWKSPWTGTVAVSGGVQDIQPGGFDGIGWSIDSFDGLNNSTVASGSIPTGGEQEFQNGFGGANLASVVVNLGDWIYFVIDPASDNGGDSTRLDIVITPTSGCEPPTNYCIGAINTTGHGARIYSQGSTSVTDNNLVLLANGCPPEHFGIFFFGAYATEIPFGEGYLCVTGNQHRLTPPVHLSNSGAASLALDFTDPDSPASLIAAGSQWNFQFWYRDPQEVGHGFNFTDALSAHFCP